MGDVTKIVVPTGEWYKPLSAYFSATTCIIPLMLEESLGTRLEFIHSWALKLMADYMLYHLPVILLG